MKVILSLLALASVVVAEDGHAGWLRYAPLPRALQLLHSPSLPTKIVSLNSSTLSPVFVAGQELQKGVNGILGHQLDVVHQSSRASSSVVVGTVEEYTKAFGPVHGAADLDDDGFWLSVQGNTVQIIGKNERGALYGSFEYLSRLAQANFANVATASNPDAAIRWINQWDNINGVIERGYGGTSLFWANGTIKSDLSTAAEYARLLASIRINGIVINNVNANETVLTAQNIDGIGRVADVFRPWGINVGISLNFASPQLLGDLNTYDPLDPAVIQWWQNKTDAIYARTPDFAGYLVKANSEGQPGPLTYNRTLADGANLFATAIKPHGGIVMFRAFVYNSNLNESDWYADRALAAVDYFNGLDGIFMDNVVIQIKYGPIDFQVREPPSPLFAHLQETSSAIELQITQEYLGQQTHLVFNPPIWKTILDFDLRIDGKKSLVRDTVSGKRLGRKLGGYAGVANAGTNTTWMGSHLAMSNLFTYGHLAWDATQEPRDILQDWVRLTFGLDPVVLNTITDMSMESWPTYENYSGNLGVQTLTDILFTHFGARPQSQDNNGYGQWTRADPNGIGMDRTVKNGTKFAGQYPPEVAAMFENIDTTPDDLLLWFHHVPYTQRLKSGKTVVQHFYDAHYEGATNAQTFPKRWASLKGKIDDERFEDVLFRLTFQASHSIVWRDSINYWIYNTSGIPDTAGRVGKKPNPLRIEAETMTLDGYSVYPVAPFEAASNFTAIVTSSNTTAGTASTKLNSIASGTYDLVVAYFDMYAGKATWDVTLNNVAVGSWVGNNEDRLFHEQSRYVDAQTATRITFHNVKVNKGDTLKIVGTPDGLEPAPIDYVALLPPGKLD